jgi:hypothetical protein
MKKLAALVLLASLLPAANAFSQTTITDQMPVSAEGLKIGYTLQTEKEKEVGNKGDFSRFTVQFYVTNESSQAKIILYKQGFTLLGNNVPPDLITFNCINATGARLTAKSVTLQAKPCTVMALVDDKDCSSDKTKLNSRPVQIGYWIKAGETISAKQVIIVPLNEKPDVRYTLFPRSNSPIGTVYNDPNGYNDPNNYNPGNNNNSNNGTADFAGNFTGFLKLKNFSNTTYLNMETGVVSSTAIDNGWWSAQWELLPVKGTAYYLIRNRWKNTYVSNESTISFNSTNDQSVNSMWMLEPVGNSNTFNIRNAGNNTYLNTQSGKLQCTNVNSGQMNARWIIERE